MQAFDKKLLSSSEITEKWNYNQYIYYDSQLIEIEQNGNWDQ
jgi:hypothetical protein